MARPPCSWSWCPSPAQASQGCLPLQPHSLLPFLSWPWWDSQNLQASRASDPPSLHRQGN